MTNHPPRIQDYGLIGDMQTAALVCRDGSVDWLCLPHFDSDAVFAHLLGTEEHGFWRIGPAAPNGARPWASRRRYRGDTLILESEWDTPTGQVRLIDFMPPHGADDPQLIRIVQGVTGTVPMTSSLCARFGYGRHLPWIHEEGGRTVAEVGEHALWLDAPVNSTEKAGTLHTAFTVTAGERIAFRLTRASSYGPAPRITDADTALDATDTFWRTWAEQCTYNGPHRAAVIRSLITLKAMTFAPSGAIVAAPTTSLPEEIGGVRNWDYRYAWLRDSAITLSALLSTGYRDEAAAWRQWLLRALGGDPQNMQIMYGIRGERDLPERELAWLPGYAASRPVRVGNAAADQFQLDVPGEVIETLYLAHENGVARCDSTAALHLRVVDYVAAHWREPDDGIWEVRGGRRHFVHSKIMAWAAVDRTVRLAQAGALAMDPADLDALSQLRADIHAEVCDKGYDPIRNTFTQSYGSNDLDASLLLIPRTGFLPPDDPRVVGTVAAVRRELTTADGLVHRYPTSGRRTGSDGLPGDEGAFLLCSFWLVDALALTGQRNEARHLYERLLEASSDLGLLAEEYDPATGDQLGNFPQAFSHIGLVLSAVLLHEQEQATAPVMAA
jgi:GH15 family glucan-1,4-alpha-glucosidase